MIEVKNLSKRFLTGRGRKTQVVPGPAAPKDAEAVPDAGARPASQPSHPASSPTPAT